MITDPVLVFLWQYATFPLWYLQPSYPDPDAWIVLAFYELLWIIFHVAFILGVSYALAKRFPPES